tara:strand:- start:161 stop:547 length:387 start_codon:yes stop_codon:yes gene_type:complete
MASTNRYKAKKRGQPSFVMLYHWMQDSEAWLDLKPQPRILYVELKRRFKGNNNGEIYLSHRDAAQLLNMHRNSIGRYFDILIEHGFLKQTSRPHLGPSGVGQSSKWELTELPVKQRPATKEFMRWRKK